MNAELAGFPRSSLDQLSRIIPTRDPFPFLLSFLCYPFGLTPPLMDYLFHRTFYCTSSFRPVNLDCDSYAIGYSSHHYHAIARPVFLLVDYWMVRLRLYSLYDYIATPVSYIRLSAIRWKGQS